LFHSEKVAFLSHFFATKREVNTMFLNHLKQHVLKKTCLIHFDMEMHTMTKTLFLLFIFICTTEKYFALNISNIIQSKMYIHIGTLQKTSAFVIVWNILRNENFENKTICKRRSGWTRKITRLNILAFSTTLQLTRYLISSTPCHERKLNSQM
jgi:hypothetical protein